MSNPVVTIEMEDGATIKLFSRTHHPQMGAIDLQARGSVGEQNNNTGASEKQTQRKYLGRGKD